MGRSRVSKRRHSNKNEELQTKKYKHHKGGEDESVSSAAIRVATTNDLSPVVVFAHGAGASSSSDWMIRWKNMLAKALKAVEVVTFDYPFFANGVRKGVPKAENLVEFHYEVVKKTMSLYPSHSLILAGKSMGSRVSCMVAAKEDINPLAVICFGYPLKAKKGDLRDAPLLQLTVPVMFVQGSNDGLCPLEKLESVREKMVSNNKLLVIEGGDHSLHIGKKHLNLTGTTQQEVETLALLDIVKFVETID